jgi:site-specific DNA recombinase
MISGNQFQGSLQPPLVAKNGTTLKVLAVCRISTVHQDERSLDDQQAMYRSWLGANTQLPFDMTVVASQGSGECIDREEYLQTLDLIESGDFDVVICEDLSRICRRVQAIIACETCEDTDTRLIAINDSVDTGQDNWRLNSFFAVMKHESCNTDTSKRIRRSLRNRFSQGGVVQTIIYGYIKPPDTTSDDQLQKDPSAESVYAEWFRRLEEGQSFAEIADWLNEQEVPTGPYARSDHWIGTMVGQVTRNQILKGTRVRNRKISKRVNRTGRRKSINAPPEELLERHCPHLAFIEPARYDRVIRMITERNAIYKRHEVNGRDPRKDVPKKRSRWPGQHINCGVCGRMYVFGGHGQTDRLMCSGAREHKCWNGITVDGPLAAERVSAAILAQIETLQEFDAVISTCSWSRCFGLGHVLFSCSRRILNVEL